MTTGERHPGEGPAGDDGPALRAPAGGGFEAADPAVPGWGSAFGSGYRLQREIGVGGMGTVWRGWSTAGQRVVAIKVLHPHLSADRSVVARFLREGDVLKRLEHPNVVRVHDLVVEGGRLGLVMDLVEGGDLHARRKRLGTLAPAEAARIGAQAAGALAAAHALGIAHLDLKPANILISPRPRPDGAAEGADAAPAAETAETAATAATAATAESTESAKPAEPSAGAYDVRLTDFGISRTMDSPDQATTTTTYGTPDYISPETGLTGTTGPACDLYALGITLYEVLVGRTPYGGGNALTVLSRHIERMPRRLSTIPDPLWEVIAACTAREPADRPDAAGTAAYLAAAVAGLAGLPAAEPLPPGTGFEATSELRPAQPDAVTIAVPWLAAVAAANRPAQAIAEDRDATSGDEAFAAALRKPPPSGPFSTAPTRPELNEHPDRPAASSPGAARRRAALIGAPLLVLAVVGALFASGVFDGAPTRSGADSRAIVAPGSAGGSGGPGLSASGAIGSAPTSVTATGSKPATSKTASEGASAGGTVSPGGNGNGGTTVVGSSAAVTETTTTAAGGSGPTAIPTSARPPASSPSPSPTDSGWVCRVGGFKVDGALSEDPCVRDDDGTVMLEGELKGTYDSPVVVVVRVDYQGTYSSARISQTVTPAQLGGKTFVYEVTIGAWAPNEVITCQENVDPASDKTDYEYTSNSADLRT